MTAAEILRNAQPPADDALIDKAIADLDHKIWEWTDALKSAHEQLRTAFAVRPPSPRPSASLFDRPAVTPDLQAAAAAAHIAAPPPMPAEWTAPPPAPRERAASPAGQAPMPAEWTPPAPPAAPEPRWASNHGGHGASGGPRQAPPAANWAQPSAQGPAAFQGADPAPSSSTGVMQWPSANNSNPWPDSGTSSASTGPQSWPTWTPTDASGGGSGSAEKKGAASSSSAPFRPGKAKGPRPVQPQGPSAEERAQKAAAEEALLSELEDAIARRVRLLRRLDPDTAIEKLIDKAIQGHAEAMAAAPPKDDKASSASWWRRK